MLTQKFGDFVNFSSVNSHLLSALLNFKLGLQGGNGQFLDSSRRL